LLLDYLGHGVLQSLRGCPRIRCTDTDLRRRDAGILRDWQAEYGDSAGEHDHQGDHPCKDRAVNEEARHYACSASMPVAFSPGRTFCTPSTMTRSPGTTPS